MNMNLGKDKEFVIESIISNTVISEKKLEKYNLPTDVKKEICALVEAREGYINTSDEIYNICAMLLAQMLLTDLKIQQQLGRISLEDFYELKEEYCY